MDDFSKKEFGFQERGMMETDGMPMGYWPLKSAQGVPIRVAVTNTTRPSSEYFNRSVESLVEDGEEDEDQTKLISVSVEFLGADNNEKHGLIFELTPKLATVVAHAMLTHASSDLSVDMVSRTQIQTHDDYVAEMKENSRFGYWDN
jgi:hypothetical protein